MRRRAASFVVDVSGRADTSSSAFLARLAPQVQRDHAIIMLDALKQTDAFPQAAQALAKGSNGCHKYPTDCLLRRQALVDRALGGVLRLAKGSPSILEVAMRYCLESGGKRFRPLLCLGGCEAVGRAPRAALTVACALEMIHTYSLVHDDLPAMDNADQRRGKPSCHRKFGEAPAILVGDALLTLAFEQLGNSPSANALRIIRRIAQASGTRGLIGGQVLDLEPATDACSMSRNRLRAIALRKTAALIEVSVVCGALVGGAGPLQLKRLERYGQAIGLAFQMIDDLHDAEGFARTMNVKDLRTEVEDLIHQAIQALAPFGKRADALRDLARWLESSIGETAQGVR